MKTLKQITTPQDFLIGKTIVKTGKGKDPFSGTVVISFIFSDDTYVLFRCTADGILMIPDLEIIPNNSNMDKKHISMNTEYIKFLFDIGLAEQEDVDMAQKNRDDYFLSQDKEYFIQLIKKHPEFKKLV